MFIGHYAAAYAIKAKEPKASLGLLFIAVQFVDILFFPFAVLGIERLSLVKGFTETNDFVMEHYPFTHGLAASFIWAILTYCLFYFVLLKKAKYRKRVSTALALGVLSHWFMDLIVHTPDLPLIYGDPKFGFGLWHNKFATVLTELILLIAAWWMYNRSQHTEKLNIKSISLLLLMVFVCYLNYYLLPPPEAIVPLTISALATYFLLALFAHWTEPTKSTHISQI